jgi:imidazolonepropionase-like amidohydrolase
MKRLPTIRTLALLTSGGLVWSCSAPRKSTLAITHVTVIDATGAPPQRDMTVLIADQRITALGPTNSIKIPDGSQVLNGASKFLIPGLTDMHVHLTGAGEPSGSREFILPLLLANGITMVRDMGGRVEDLARLRIEISSGARLGPQIFFTGPYLEGDRPDNQPSIVVRSASEARTATDRLANEGVDFIKAQSSLSREAYFAISEEATQLHIRFVGHVPDRVSALEASRAGQASIEHLTGILLACSSNEEELRRESLVAAPPNETPAQAHARERAWRRELLNSYSPKKANALLHAFASNGTWQVPTFPILVDLAFVTPATNLWNDQRMTYVPQNERKIWNHGVKGQLENYSAADFALREEIVKRSFEIAGKMQAASVHIMAGTDIAAPNVFPGSSLHDDMAFLVEAGLTPMQALQAATRSPAEFLGKLQTQGTVEISKSADLVLLDGDPLADIHNTQTIRAVLLHGKLLNRADLDSLLQGVAKFAENH